MDDLQLLDSTSATLVGQLVDAGLVFLVATVRTGEYVPAGLEALWQRARVRRIDLDDLDRASVDTLLHLVLRGPIESGTTTDIWVASQGNALFVRELVLAALGGGQLVEQRGVWRLVGPLVATARLHELVAARLGRLDPSATEVLDVLAVWEPTGLSMLEATVGRDRLEAVDRAGLLVVRTDGRRQQVAFSHPLYGEIVRARMPALTRRRLLLAHADLIESFGARRREDAIRVAAARLEASGWADPALLLRAARLARYGGDFVQVERFGRAALVEGMTPEIGLLLGEALHELGRFAEADQVLADAAAATADEDELIVHLTEIRSRNLMWGLLRFDDALDLNRQVRARLSDDAADELVLNEALLLAYGGRPLDALAMLEPATAPSSLRARALRALAEVPALVGVGPLRVRGRRSRAGLRRAQPASRPGRDTAPGRAPAHTGLCAHRVRTVGGGLRTGDRGVRRHAGQRSPGCAHVAGPPARPLQPARGPDRDRPPLAEGGPGTMRPARQRRTPPPRALSTGGRRRVRRRRRGGGPSGGRARPAPPLRLRGTRARAGSGVGARRGRRPPHGQGGAGDRGPGRGGDGLSHLRGMAPPRHRPARRSGLGRGAALHAGR